MSADVGFVHTKLGAPGHVTATSEAENRKKGDKFKLVYLGKY